MIRGLAATFVRLPASKRSFVSIASSRGAQPSSVEAVLPLVAQAPSSVSSRLSESVRSEVALPSWWPTGAVTTWTTPAAGMEMPSFSNTRVQEAPEMLYDDSKAPMWCPETESSLENGSISAMNRNMREPRKVRTLKPRPLAALASVAPVLLDLILLTDLVSRFHVSPFDCRPTMVRAPARRSAGAGRSSAARVSTRTSRADAARATTRER
jgi:hypothetical protein